MVKSGWRRARSLGVAITIVILLFQPGIATGVAYYELLLSSMTAVNPPEVILQSGIAGSSTIYMNGTSAKVSVSGGLQVSQDVKVASSSNAYGYMYTTQRHVVRTTDPNKTIHVFFLDSAGYIQWYKSIDNGQTFSQALSPTQQAGSLSVAKDAANNIHLVYERLPVGAICYRKQTYNATGWGTEITLDYASNRYYPSIAIAPYNNNWIYVVYDSHSSSGPKRSRWYFTYSTDGGSTWQTPWGGTLNEYSVAHTIGTFPSIVIDNTRGTYGHIYVTWFSGNLYLYIRRGIIGSTGAVTWDLTAQTISSGMSSASTTVNTNMMHSAIYVNGKYRLVYCESGTAKYRDWDEATWSTPISMATVSNYPSLTHDESGYLYIFYETNVAHSSYDIRYQESNDATPTGFGSPQNITNDNIGNHRVSTEVDGERIEFIRAQGTTTPCNIQFNYLAPTPQDFDYVLKVVNLSNLRKIRLKAYSDTNLNRLENCTIYSYNGGGTSQIVIIKGSYEKQTGTWYDLASYDTDYIAIHVEASWGVSYIYVYLEILVPNTTTYAQYIMTFEID